MISAIRWKKPAQTCFKVESERATYLIDFVTDIFLEIALDVAQQWDIENAGNDEHEHGTSADQDSEQHSARQDSGDEGVASEVL
jgi:hypothetical protein